MTTCIPRAIGVPGLNSQGPTWPAIAPVNGHAAWDANSISTPNGLDDPRWAGHLAIGYPEIATAPASCTGTVTPSRPVFGSASDDDAIFRALYSVEGGDNVLYLSWWIKADTDANHALDVLYVGFERQTGDPMLIEIEPFDAVGAPLSSAAAHIVNVSTVHTAPATATEQPGQVKPWTENGGARPSWIDANTHVWLDPGTDRWAVQMRVPIGSADVDTELDIASTFQFWYEMRVVFTDPGSGDSLMVPYSWPRGACVVDVGGTFPNIATHAPDPAIWDEMHLSTGPGDPACPSDGFVTISRTDIGTLNTPTSAIELNLPNTFEARPHNETGSVVGVGEITAEFRLANWGSVADPLAPWSLIPGAGNPASNGVAINDGAQGNIQIGWTLTPTERNEFDGPTAFKSKHQCMLVTLSGPLVFNPASVWRNMDFVPASRFERVAELSNVGLGVSPVAGDPRPAYVMITKLNMPRQVTQERPPTDGEGDGRKPPPNDGRFLRPVPADHGEDHDDDDRDGDDRDPRDLLADAALKTEDPVERLEVTQPTIRYHTFHDTGVVVTRAGNDYKVLRAGTGFGYWVNHQGSLTGWSDELQGATRITDTLYRLDIPEEGSVKVSTVIEAIEEQGGLESWWRRLIRLLIALLRKLAKLLGRLVRTVIKRVRRLLGR